MFKSISIKSLFVAISALVLSTSANASLVQYNMTFDGSVQGASGIGSFNWDTNTNEMSSLTWNFGGAIGGILDSRLDDIFPGGDTLGAIMFETITGSNVALSGVYSNSGFAFSGGGYGTLNFTRAIFFGSVHGATYSIDVSGIKQFEGVYSVAKASVVPVPAAAWLFISGLLGLAGVARRRKS